MEKQVRLGPEGFDSIAILGSAPSSCLLAPFNDEKWAIWGTSPSCWSQLSGRRSDVWFELHRFLPYPPGQSQSPGTRPWFSPEFHQFLKEHPTVYMTEYHPEIGNHQYPYQAMRDKHGDYHFCSSVSWMLALAIETLAPLVAEGKRPKLGMFGVDMAAGSEWAYQRPACQHFLGLAKNMGIEIVLPPESDLMRPATLYGIGEHTERHVKISERIKEMEAQKANAEQMAQQAQMSLQRIQGALDAYEYVLSCWCDDTNPDIAQAMSFSGAFKQTLPNTTPPDDVVSHEVVNFN